MNELKDKIGYVVTDVRERLSEGEMPKGEFQNYILDRLKHYEVVPADFLTNLVRKDAEALGHFLANLYIKLNLRRLDGLLQGYVALPTKHLSDETEKDVSALEGLSESAKKHFSKTLVGNKPLERSELTDLVKDYVNGHSGVEDGMRRAEISGLVLYDMKAYFRVVDKESVYFGVPESEFDKMFEEEE